MTQKPDTPFSWRGFAYTAFVLILGGLFSAIMIAAFLAAATSLTSMD